MHQFKINTVLLPFLNNSEGRECIRDRHTGRYERQSHHGVRDAQSEAYIQNLNWIRCSECYSLRP